jgi:hypothetical protein
MKIAKDASGNVSTPLEYMFQFYFFVSFDKPVT